jgi:tetratricopeptide (TPR) repeat protein
MRLVDQFTVDAARVTPDAVAYQISAVREFLRDLRPPDPETTSLREIVQVAEAAHVSGDRRMLISPLLAFAFWLEEALRLDEALDVLDTTLELCAGTEADELVAIHLQRGRVLRLHGQFGEATESYAAAASLATDLGDAHSVFLARIGRGIVLQKLGNLPAAERLLREVAADAQLVGDRDAEARAIHDLAGTLYLTGRIKDAIPLAFRAFELYDRPLHRCRALSDVGTLLKELGHYAAAEKAFAAVLSHKLSAEVRARSVLEMLELSAILGDRVAFQRWRRDLQQSIDQLPLDDQLDYEMKVGAGLAQFGHNAQGEAHLLRAIELAEQHRLGERLFEAEGLLSEIRKRHTEQLVGAAPTQESFENEPQLRSTLESLLALETSS